MSSEMNMATLFGRCGLGVEAGETEPKKAVQEKNASRHHNGPMAGGF